MRLKKPSEISKQACLFHRELRVFWWRPQLQTNFATKTWYFELPWLTVTHWSAFGLHGCYPLGKYRDKDPRTVTNYGVHNWKLLLFLSSNKLDPLISWKRIICMIISQSVCFSRGRGTGWAEWAFAHPNFWETSGKLLTRPRIWGNKAYFWLCKNM